MHARIKELVDEINKLSLENVLDWRVLVYLHKNGATATETAIALHLGYNIPLKEAENFVLKSNTFPMEDLNEVAFQTFLYFSE